MSHPWENVLATPAPFYADDTVELYHADCRDLLPKLRGDLIVTDPPYEQTSLRWDRWPAGWLDAAADCASAMWCFCRCASSPRSRTAAGSSRRPADASRKTSNPISGTRPTT